jgi:hypothetical protein
VLAGRRVMRQSILAPGSTDSGLDPSSPERALADALGNVAQARMLSVGAAAVAAVALLLALIVLIVVI